MSGLLTKKTIEFAVSTLPSLLNLDLALWFKPIAQLIVTESTAFLIKLILISVFVPFLVVPEMFINITVEEGATEITLQCDGKDRRVAWFDGIT